MLSRRLLRIKVFKSLYSHHISARTTVDGSFKEYVKSTERCYDLYLMLLELPSMVADYAEERIKIASEKLRPTAEDLAPNRRFVDNPIIAQLRDWDRLNITLKDRKLDWGVDATDIAKDIYDDMLCTESYKKYMKGSMNHRTYLEKFYEELFEDNEKFENLIESLSIFWADDLNFALIQVIRTIKSSPMELFAQYSDSEVREFGEKLFLNSARNMKDYMELVDKFAKNWELERIAISDRLLLVEGIAELVGCPTIPTKVTMDEYIEISKHFSTPQSSTFINGILHKACDELTKEGKIVKTGRGLLESIN